MSERIAHAQWTVEQISNLRKLRYQVADKSVGNVLVELYNRKVLEAGLVVVGTLAYMSWLNEYGAMAVAARTQDLDLARRQHLKLAAPTPFMDSIKRTATPVPPNTRHAEQCPSNVGSNFPDATDFAWTYSHQARNWEKSFRYRSCNGTPKQSLTMTICSRILSTPQCSPGDIASRSRCQESIA